MVEMTAVRAPRAYSSHSLFTKIYSWLLVSCNRDTFRKLRTITERYELTRELQDCICTKSSKFI